METASVEEATDETGNSAQRVKRSYRICMQGVELFLGLSESKRTNLMLMLELAYEAFTVLLPEVKFLCHLYTSLFFFHI